MAGVFNEKPPHSELLTHLPSFWIFPLSIKTPIHPSGVLDRKELLGTSCIALNSQGAENEKRGEGATHTHTRQHIHKNSSNYFHSGVAGRGPTPKEVKLGSVGEIRQATGWRQPRSPLFPDMTEPLFSGRKEEKHEYYQMQCRRG